jgi:peptidoglycan/LPS O-acetylase OafA/YrhL
MNAVGYSWISAFYLSVLLVAIIDRGRTVGRFFRNPGLQWLGIASYFIYLFHNTILGLLHEAVLGRQPLIDSSTSFIVTVAAAAITFAAAGLSWKYFESPLVMRGRQYRY